MEIIGWIIGWIALGALAGWIASVTTGNKKMGIGANITVGIIGGFIGGLIMNLFGGREITCSPWPA